MTSGHNLTTEQIAWLKALPMSKRAAVVRDRILANGSVTTAELEALGYAHPPRAATDLRDAGAGVKTTMIMVDGKRMASYSFDGTFRDDGAPRVVIPKKFADDLKAAYGYRCSVCGGVYESRLLQADHRIPFAIAGDQAQMRQADFMPLCAPDNRAKSWSCENCSNWKVRDPSTCATCFWASPENYEHVETRPERRLVVTFQAGEVAAYDALRLTAEYGGRSVADVAKDLLS